MTKAYSVPLTEIRREHVVVNSRFIATLAPAFSIDEARTFMARIKKEFADATHNVPVYIIGGGNTVTEYFSDDGEPAGTAGKPALVALLGTGGLVKAYTESAQMVVNAVGRGERVPVHVALLAIPYNLLERVRLVVTRQRGEVLGEDFGADVTLTIRVPVDSFDAFQNDLRELSAGKLQAEVIETKEMVVSN